MCFCRLLLAIERFEGVQSFISPAIYLKIVYNLGKERAINQMWSRVKGPCSIKKCKFLLLYCSTTLCSSIADSVIVPKGIFYSEIYENRSINRQIVIHNIVHNFTPHPVNNLDVNQ